MALAAWEEPAPLEGMDPLERGSLVHSILENFLENHCGEKFWAASEEELRHSLASLAKEALEEARPAGIPDLLWEIERDAFLALLDRWLVFEKDRAGGRTCFPPAGAGIWRSSSPASGIRHFVCRPAGTRLTSGAESIASMFRATENRRASSITRPALCLIPWREKWRTPLMSGERIQIVVYRGALSVLDEFKNVEDVEGEYLHLQPKDGRIVPCRFTDEELREAAETLPDILEIVGDGIESGAFFARTSGTVRPSGHCEYCDYLPVCGKDRVQREERKANDPAVRKFLRISGAEAMKLESRISESRSRRRQRGAELSKKQAGLLSSKLPPAPAKRARSWTGFFISCWKKGRTDLPCRFPGSARLLLPRKRRER